MSPNKLTELLADGRAKRLSPPDRAALHGYFDLCCESPDRRWVVMTVFDDAVPGPADVVVMDQADGSRRTVGRTPHANTHGGAMPVWAGSDIIAWSGVRDGRGVTCLAGVDGEPRGELGCVVRMFRPAGDAALASSHGWRRVGLEPDTEAVYLVTLADRKVRRLFTRDDVLSVHPMRDVAASVGPETLKFKHTKWSPTGERFFVVFTNEGLARRNPDIPRIKSLMVADADGGNLRHLTEFGHHPRWSEDGALCYWFEPGPDGQALMTMDPDGGEPSVLAAGVPGTHSSLAADNRTLLTDIRLRAEQPAWKVSLYDLRTGERRTLATMADTERRHEVRCHPHPAWSRDEQRVYFNSNAEGRHQLYTMAVSEARPEPETS